MESLHEKKNLHVNIKKRKRKHFNKSKDENYINEDSQINNEFKKKKLDEEDVILHKKKKPDPGLLQVVKSKTEIEDILKDYVAEDIEEHKTTSQKQKISLKKLKKLERIKKRKENSLPAKDPSAEERTIFVGNVNINSKRDKIKIFFSKYGEVETVRLRGIAPESLNMSKKEAVAKKLFNPHRKSLNAYVRFKDVDSVTKALEANGTIFNELHIHVDKAMATNCKDLNSVFVGNLPWEVNEEDLWKFFENCGKVTNVRIVRSSTTGAGKGFGFVSFDSKDGVQMALFLDKNIFMNRELRVKKIAKKVKENKEFKDTRRGKMKNAMDVSFLQRDKPYFREKKIKEKKRGRKPRKTDFLSESGNFKGIKAVKEGKALKKVKRKSLDERRKISIAMKLANA